MHPCLTLEYWIDSGWYVGRVKEVPGVFSQGKTLAELKANIQDAYHLMMEVSVVAMSTLILCLGDRGRGFHG